MLEPYHFTVKYRLQSTDDWVWVNDQFSKADGEIYFQPPNLPGKSPSQEETLGGDDLLNYIDNLQGSRLSIHAVNSETPDTKLWTIIGQASSEYETYTLGRPSNCNRWFSLVRIWTPWLAPRHGKTSFSTTEDAILCSFLRWDGLHLVLLAVSGIDDVTTVFKSDTKGNVVISGRNDNELGDGLCTVIAAVGRTFDSAIAAAMYHARKMIAGTAEEIEQARKEIKPEWLENWYDGLTYCTWNGLGQALTEQKIYNALDVLRKNAIKG